MPTEEELSATELKLQVLVRDAARYALVHACA